MVLLSVKDINDDMKDVEGFNGCYILEDLEKLKLKEGYYIVLILNRNVGNVGHYVSFSLKDGKVWYFDSYGMTPPIELEAIWKKNGIEDYHYGNIDVQSTSNDSTDCGYFAMYIVRGLSNGHSPEEIYESLYNDKGKLDMNDKIVENYTKKLEGCMLKKKDSKGGYSLKKLTEPITRVINFIKGVRIGFSPQIVNFLEVNSSANIIAIVVERNPIDGVINKAMNLLSLGRFDQNKTSLGYDNVFHLYMTITLDNGVSFVAEKNQVIQFKHVSTSTNRNGEQMPVTINEPINVVEFFANGIKSMGENAFFRYSSYEYNCQHWITGVLKANNLMNDELYKFINQDAASLFKNIEYLKPITRGITDFAARLDRLFSGGDIHGYYKSIKPPNPVGCGAQVQNSNGNSFRDPNYDYLKDYKLFYESNPGFVPDKTYGDNFLFGRGFYY